MMKRRSKRTLSIVTAAALSLSLLQPANIGWASDSDSSNVLAAAEEPFDYKLAIDATAPGAAISPNLNGIFLEDINYAGDGGLYAELVQNRSFEFDERLRAWSKVTTGGGVGTLTVESDNPLNKNNLRYARLIVQTPGQGVGIANTGFGGIAVEKGEGYDFSVYVRSQGAFDAPLSIALQNADGETIGQTTIEGITESWQKLTAELTAEETAASTKLVVTTKGTGTIELDMVSLFPKKTWKSRPGGLRPDLVQMMADMKPKFIRFPGGSIVGGRSVDNFYRWKNTIGDVAERPINKNFWSDPARGNDPYYYQTGGLGFFEYFQLSEDLGAEPLPVLNVGMAEQFLAPGVVVPLDELQPYIQDALDLIEYANGPATSEWGAKRAAAGHPEPFNLKYVSLGNEHWTQAYFDRYQLFYDAIKAKYPEINLMLSSGAYASGNEFNTAWDWVRETGKAEVVDEHMYQPPTWFLNNTNRYDGYDRSGPPVFVGEYAAHIGSGDKGRISSMQGAISEAAFMTGLERNGDIVRFASYAPTFAKENNVQWTPDLIWFNNKTTYGAPSYYVQQLFSENVGDTVVPSELTRQSEQQARPVTGKIMLATWATSVDYDDVLVKSNNGETLFSDDFSAAGSSWTTAGGSWQVTDGVMRQAGNATPARTVAGDASWSNYTLTMKATKKSGGEGMLVGFGVKDTDNYYWWNIGGWGNTRTVVEKAVGGGKSEIGAVNTTFRVETGKTYDIKIELNGATVKCYIDGQLMHSFSDTGASAQQLYSVVSKDAQSGDLIAKLVNSGPDAQTVRLDLSGAGEIEPFGTAIELTADEPGDQNSFADPLHVAPAIKLLEGVSSSFNYELAGNSVVVLRLKTKAGIASAGTAEVVTAEHSAPALPEKLPVVYSDGTEGEAEVDWNDVRQFQYDQPGTFRVNGTIAGVPYVVHANVTVTEGTEPEPEQQPELVLRYNFDEADGTTVTDASGHGHDGIINGTLNRETSGKQGGALSFAGANGNYVNAGTSGDLQPGSVTVSYWIKRTTDMASAENVLLWFKPTSGYNQNGMYITYNGADASNPYSSFVVIDGFNGFYVKASPNDFLPLNEWTHIAVTFDSASNAAAIYRNGEAQQLSNVGAPDSITATEDAKKIGVSGYNNGGQLNAQLDDLRLYRGAMTASQIQAVYEGRDIRSVQEINVSTIAGIAPKLPRTVIVQYENGSEGTAVVDWETLDPADYQTAGQFTVTGTLKGTTLQAQATITVEEAPASIPHLVARYAFDETEGSDVHDLSGSGLHGVVKGDEPTWLSDGHEDGALQFNGTNNGIELGTSPDLQPGSVTVSYWIKRTEAMDGRNSNIVWFKEGWNGNGFYITYDGSNPADLSSSYMIVDGFNGFYVKESPDQFLPLNEWTHIAVTFDSETNEGAIYKNGEKQTITINGTPNSITPTSAKNKLIGMSEYSNSHLNAGLDDLRIYNAALSEAEIKTLYEGEAAQPSGGTITGPEEVAGSASFDVSFGLNGVTPDMKAFDALITYDSDKLTYEGIGEELSDRVKLVGDASQPGEVRLLLANVDPQDEADFSGPIVKLKFKAKDTDEAGLANISATSIVAADGTGKETELASAVWSVRINGVDKAALNALIAETQQAHDAAVEGTKPGQYPAGAKAALQQAIDKAKSIAANANATKAQVEQAASELNEALQRFKAQVIKPRTGDISGDDKITIGDLGIVAGYYGTASTNPKWEQIRKSDLNDDGVIDILDLAALARLILE
ncbi:alpha-L-arabinofuranosidase [Paenibacillus phyllosphaerae]|uniref:non-reducing end alpha-L-arabinofuranosidase n=1 Tax=Paenibacillus phyllosphaerae TaxID=274593 RepID=A0A7W5B4B7_9BACL|nr:LamG-like jellyroll fold domain-containing protein [Paenibacillus phyllosphaerae]MBB3114169.1 alpha-L-arabinofuranosidase [Paenibacillus phyllosphaerae]